MQYPIYEEKWHMKTFEKFVFILIILFIINLIFGNILGAFIERLFSGSREGILRLHYNFLMTSPLFISYLVNLAMGCWLFVDARNRHRNKWVWAFFGLLFGVLAVIIYLLFVLTEEIRMLSKERTESVYS